MATAWPQNLHHPTTRHYLWADCATTANIANFAAASILHDGVLLAPEMVLLVKNQGVTSQNGPYRVVSVGVNAVLVRLEGTSESNLLQPGCVCAVAMGTSYAGRVFQMISGTTPEAFVVGTSTQTWSLIRAGVADQALDVLLSPVEWDDLAFPATAINPPGAIGPAQYDAAESTLDFQEGFSQRIDVTYQLPHGYVEGSATKFHLHAMHSAGGVGNIRWSLSWRLIVDGSAHPGWTTEVIPIAAPADTLEHYYLVRAFSAAELAATKISDRIQIQLVRTGGHGDDTYNGDLKVSSLDLHIQKNTIGSNSETSKF